MKLDGNRLRKGDSVKNKFFTRKFAPAQCDKSHESLQVAEWHGY
jgi:hypothetical protein